MSVVDIHSQKEKIWSLLHRVKDPEIPVLSIVDLGIVHKISYCNSHWKIEICPTYSGCPALDTIKNDISAMLHKENIHHMVAYTFDEIWSTDKISEEGRKKLLAYGIAPPMTVLKDDLANEDFKNIACPQCGSTKTECISQFGSTACKALHSCLDCKEPFDYFKCK